MSDDEYFPLAGHVWVVIDNKCVPPVIAERMLRPEGRESGKWNLAMNESERREFGSLPEEFDVYRGCTRDTAENCSWSLDTLKAREFAVKFAGAIVDLMNDEDQTPVVIQGRCHKKDVLAVFTRFGEKEIVVNPACLSGRREVWHG